MTLPTAAALAASPRWFPHLLDPVHDRLLLVDKDEEEYRVASFLDDRSLRQDRARHIAKWRDVAAALAGPPRRDAHYIFHIGHVGSTLVSRLLGELPGILALREPAILRTLADLLGEENRPESVWSPDDVSKRLDTLTALISRTFRPEQRVTIKATSFVSDFAARLVPEGSKALLLYSRPERYIETILAGDNSRQDMRMSGGERLRRLHRRTGEPRWRRWELGEGRLVGMAWATEMTALLAAAEDLPAGATMWLEFDDFLAEPAMWLERITGFLGETLSPLDAEQLAASPLMRRYSKAPEYEYGPELRRQLLQQARREHGAARGEALHWLEAAGGAVPLIGRCLQLAARSTDA
jgi:hypothetical protein